MITNNVRREQIVSQGKSKMRRRSVKGEGNM